MRWWFWRGKTMFWRVIEETGRRHGQLERLGGLTPKAARSHPEGSGDTPHGTRILQGFMLRKLVLVLDC